MATGTISYKVSLKPSMKLLLVLSAYLHWDWLTKKCFTMEIVTDNTVDL